MDARFGGAGKPGGGGGFPGGPMKGASSWQVYYTPEGHPYYYNTMTGHTQVRVRLSDIRRVCASVFDDVGLLAWCAVGAPR
jgi:hypothetical protein